MMLSTTRPAQMLAGPVPVAASLHRNTCPTWPTCPSPNSSAQQKTACAATFQSEPTPACSLSTPLPCHGRRHVFCKAAAVAGQQGPKVGTVIVDHGSRKKDSNDMLFEFVKLYQQTTGADIVEAAHMEIAEPTIEQAIGKCVDQGADLIVVAPYFLSRGRHIQEDIPSLVKDAQLKYSGAKIVIAEPIGIDPLMAQLIGNRVQSALKVTTAACN